MRASCQLAAQVLQHAGTLVKPGVTTDEIDRAVHKMIIDNGAYPSPLRYGKFPKSVCTSVNECVCHGIPDSRPLEDGDIVNIDVTVYLNGYHGDTSSMFTCGNVDDKARKLCDATKEALEAAIKVCKPGAPTKAIGAACKAVADKHRLQVIAEFCGHGVGKIFHAAPMIIHDRNNQRDKMQLWQTFTIEPILCTGAPRHRIWPDKWTCVTKDGGLAAQYEHTILITPEGAEVLTVA
jgi:methionyl aminopeptidase